MESNDLPSKVQHSWLLYGSQVLYTTHGLELSTVVFFFLYMRREVHKKYLSICKNHKTLEGMNMKICKNKNKLHN